MYLYLSVYDAKLYSKRRESTLYLSTLLSIKYQGIAANTCTCTHNTMYVYV